MSRDLSIALERIGAPPRDFWENELEISIDPVLTKAAEAGAITYWLAGRHGPERLLLHHLVSVVPAQTRAQLRTAVLIPYMLVHEFTKGKSKAAAIEHAQRVLPEPLLELCRTKDGDLDPHAVCFAMYHQAPAELLSVLCLDKVYKFGFAQMRLLQNIRRPEQEFAEFLTPETVAAILRTLDVGDHPCELKRILHDGDQHTVFIRRPERPDRILRDGQMIHGYRPEWIMLEFCDSAKQVRIASSSNGASLEIANQIASGYYGAPCEYENEHLVTYRQQLYLFLRRLQAEEDSELRLVELNVSNSPFDGAPEVRIRDPRSVGPAIGHIEHTVGPMLADVDQVTSIKALFRGKRVTLHFRRIEQADDEFAVRFSDQRLSPSERRDFEEHLKVTYAIAALPTEKRIRSAA
jgi:hypothetical protein